MAQFEARPIVQLREDGTFVREFRSVYCGIKFGDEEGNFDESAICRCARGKSITYRNYIFVYKEDYTKDNVQKRVDMVKNKYSSHKKKIVSFDGNGTIKKYDSLTEAEEEFLISYVSINRALKNKKYSCVGLKWLYIDEYEDILKNNKPSEVKEVLKKMYNMSSKTKRVMRFDKNGNLIKTYNKINEAKEDGFKPSAICAVCKGRKKSYGNSIWIYEEDFSKEFLASRVQLFNSRWKGKQLNGKI